MNTTEMPYMLNNLLRRFKKQKGNKGQALAKKRKNRRRNKLARANRRLNLRRGKIGSFSS